MTVGLGHPVGSYQSRLREHLRLVVSVVSVMSVCLGLEGQQEKPTPAPANTVDSLVVTHTLYILYSRKPIHFCNSQAVGLARTLSKPHTLQQPIPFGLSRGGGLRVSQPLGLAQISTDPETWPVLLSCSFVLTFCPHSPC